MKLFESQLHKLFIKRYFIFILLFALSFQVMKTVSDIKEEVYLSGSSLTQYRECIKEFEGRPTVEKSKRINELYEERNGVYESREKLNDEYRNGSISTQEYNKKLLELNGLIETSEGFAAFYRLQESAFLDELDIIDPTAWNILFSDGIDLIGVLLMLIMVILLSLQDKETGIDLIFGTTINGKGALWRTQILFMTVFSFAYAVISGVLRYLTVGLLYGVEYGNYNIGNIEFFSGSTKTLSLFGAYALMRLIRGFGFAFFTVCAYTLGSYFKSSVNTAFTMLVITYIPAYILSGRKLLYLLPLPSGMLSGTGYFGVCSTLNKGGSCEISFGEAVAYMIFMSALTAALLMMSYFKTVGRKRR